MVQDVGMSGVELLALYGEDDGELLGAFKVPGLKTLAKVGKKAVKFTPQYWMYKGAKAGVKKIRRKKMSGENDSRISGLGVDVYYPELLGAVAKKPVPAKKKKILPGLVKGVKSVGKVTSGVTGGIAKAFIPASIVDAAAKLDPTRKKPTVKPLLKTVEKKEAVPVPAEAMKIDTKKIAIIGGSALGALVILKLLLSAPRRS